MPVKVEEEDDWSDSDDEQGLSDVETSVLLGVPDGPIKEAGDLADAAVSRIGGHPAFLTHEPPIAAAQCAVCSFPMELLVQVWCPMENSPMDRALYVWGCARSECQRKEGSVRAWRNLRRNKKYATHLEKKNTREQARKEAQEAAKAPKQPVVKSNPFSMTGNAAANPFGGGLGSQLFGVTAPSNTTIPESIPNKPEQSKAEPTNDAEDTEAKAGVEAGDAAEDELVTAIAAATLEDSVWLNVPAYPALYLSTCSEYLPPAPKIKLPVGTTNPEDDLEGGQGAGGGGFAPEGYENSMDTDPVFDRFSARVAHEPEQCLRYELEGTPLPYGSDGTFDRLFPAPKLTSTFIGKDLSTTVVPKRTYDSSTVPPCPRCNGKRIFECQLMPNLINVVGSADNDSVGKAKYATEEQRMMAVRAALQKGTGKGMEWGTCMVFSCASDCCEGDEQFAEETVLVQWEDLTS